MNKLLVILVSLFVFASCTSDDPGTQFVLSTVESVDVPASYKVDSISKFLIRYKRPTNCHIFNGMYVGVDNFTRNVAVQFAKLDQGNCEPDETVYEMPLNFQPKVSGTYLFRFWNGRTVEGIDTFLEYEAVVP